MVEEIEELGAELHPHPLAEPRILRKGNVRVAKSRPGDNVAAKVPKARYRHEHRGIEPTVCAANNARCWVALRATRPWLGVMCVVPQARLRRVRRGR